MYPQLSECRCDKHREISAKKAIIRIDFQALYLRCRLNRELIQCHTVEEERSFLLGKLTPVFEPAEYMLVLRAGGLAFHAADKAMVPGGLDPIWKVGIGFIVIGQTSLGVKQKTVGGDGACGTKSHAGGARFASIERFRLPPGIVGAGQVREGANKLEEAAHPAHKADVVPSVTRQPASHRQSLERQVGPLQLDAVKPQPFRQYVPDAFRPRRIA